MQGFNRALGFGPDGIGDRDGAQQTAVPSDKDLRARRDALA